MTDKLDISDAIMILENEKPHCGEKMIFTEEHRCEAYDMAIEALEAVGNTDTLENPTSYNKDSNDRTVSLNAVLKIIDEWYDDKADIEDLIVRVTYMPSVGKEINVPTTDYISRQEAIKAAVDAADDWDGGWNPTREGYITKALQALPSVSQEPLSVCDMCMYGNPSSTDGKPCTMCPALTKVGEING